MEKVISKDGTPIAFDRSGSGPALILVDGAMCSRGFGPMPPLAKALASRFTVYHYDRRGRGDSGDGFAYEVQREIEDLDAVVQKAGGSAMVFGISSGAALAAEAARQLRGIRRLALYEAPYVIDNTHEPLPPTFIADIKALVASNRRGAAVKKFMRYVGSAGDRCVRDVAAAVLEEAHEDRAHAVERSRDHRATSHQPAVSGREMVHHHHPDTGDGGRQEPGIHAEFDARLGASAPECRAPDPGRADPHGETGCAAAGVAELLRPCIRTGGSKRIGPSTLNG